MDPRLERLYASDLKLSRDYIRDVLKLEGDTADRVAKISGGIHADEAELLARLVRDANPSLSIEVGFGYGFSALTILASAPRPDHRHVIIDPHQTSYWKRRGWENLMDAGVADRARLIEEFSYAALPMLLAERVSADLIFIDGWHTFDFVFTDFFLGDKLLKAGGTVIFDDADWPSIRPVIRYAVTNLGYEVVGTLPEKRERAHRDIELGIEGSCIGLRKPATPLSREIFFHRDF